MAGPALEDLRRPRGLLGVAQDLAVLLALPALGWLAGAVGLPTALVAHSRVLTRG